MKRSLKSISGFTLLELLVAAGLSVLILAAAVGISTSVLRNWNRATTDLNRDAHLRFAEERLRRDFEASVLTRDVNAVWFEALPLNADEWSMRWLTEGGDGLKLVEWTVRKLDQNGVASPTFFSLFRLQVPDWETAFSTGAGLNSAKPSDRESDWWRFYLLGNILEAELEIGKIDQGNLTTLFESRQSARQNFPTTTNPIEWKPDYVKVFLRVLSDDKLIEYAQVSSGALQTTALQQWLDINSVTVVWTFHIKSELF